MATALGCLPSAIDEEPVVNVFRLLEYWLDEPPAHISLALQAAALGGRMRPAKASAAPEPSLNDTKAGMAEMAALMGPAMGRAAAAPDGFADVVGWADEMEAKVKGKTG